MENEFLDEFRDFLLKLPKDQTGNFCDQIDTMLVRFDIDFLHLVCRKIDIKKSLYTSYDAKRDLLPVSMEQLNANYCLKIVYILAYFLLCESSKGIRYKIARFLPMKVLSCGHICPLSMLWVIRLEELFNCTMEIANCVGFLKNFVNLCYFPGKLYEIIIGLLNLCEAKSTRR